MQQSLPSWLVLELASADFCPTQGEWTSPILHALDDGDDPHEVPEQLVQLCIYRVTLSPTNLTTFLLDDFFDKSLSYQSGPYTHALWQLRTFEADRPIRG